MKPISTVLCASLMASLVMGCTLTPGSHLEVAEARTHFEQNGVRVTLQPITPSVIAELEQSNTSAFDPASLIDLTDVSESPYTIGIGDVITVVVWEHPELTSPLGQFRASDEQGNVVYEDGTIFYPYAGNVPVLGKTVTEVRRMITERLQTYIENPQVDVRVAAYKSQKYLVSGDVTQPGVFPINNVPQRVLDALNTAGGISSDGNLHAVTLTRDNQQYHIPVYDILYDGQQQFNVLLQDDDVLHVQDSAPRQIFVMGEVVRPQSVALSSQPMSLTEVLSQAGGLNELRADARGVFVIRDGQSPSDILVYQVDVHQAYNFALADEFVLQPRDIVYVSAAPITRWNRFISNILPSITSIRTLDDINQN